MVITVNMPHQGASMEDISAFSKKRFYNCLRHTHWRYRAENVFGSLISTRLIYTAEHFVCFCRT